MFVWSVHLYVNVPAVENVWLNFPPGAIVPESNDALLAVAVCAVESLFVHVTVPPTEMETGFGEYAVVVKVDEPLTMEIAVVAFDGEDGELDPQPIVNPINPASTLNRNLMCLSIPRAHRKGVATSGGRISAYSAGKMRPRRRWVSEIRSPFCRRNLSVLSAVNQGQRRGAQRSDEGL
jgi:hypothetical protein